LIIIFTILLSLIFSGSAGDSSLEVLYNILSSFAISI